MLASDIVVRDDDALAAAVKWVEAGLLGPAATSVVILAVAMLGIAMLGGRIDLRAAGRVALGAFIMFGAPLIAYEISQALRSREIAIPDIAQRSTIAPAPAAMPQNAPVNDPYAGASVPQLQPQ